MRMYFCSCILCICCMLYESYFFVLLGKTSKLTGKVVSTKMKKPVIETKKGIFFTVMEPPGPWTYFYYWSVCLINSFFEAETSGIISEIEHLYFL